MGVRGWGFLGVSAQGQRSKVWSACASVTPLATGPMHSSAQSQTGGGTPWEASPAAVLLPGRLPNEGLPIIHNIPLPYILAPPEFDLSQLGSWCGSVSTSCRSTQLIASRSVAAPYTRCLSLAMIIGSLPPQAPPVERRTDPGLHTCPTVP